MRLGVRVVLCLLAFALIVGSGCRKPQTPNIDRNEAPETWITAAPLDTLTIKDSSGKPIEGSPSITTIPVRFHVYWAASDKDGAIAGFYYAVVETTATPIEGVLFAPLPGPKPQDYRFTTKTDTTFVFNVSELSPDRKHAFFIYAVDNQGKPDPTPARFIFNAIDKFPPRVVFDYARATGSIVRLTADGTPIAEERQYFVTDTLNPQTTPTDTVPAFSRMDFRWHGEITLAGTYVTQYRFKFDEPQFVTVDSSVHVATYGVTAPISAGTKLFTLRALDQAGGAGFATRRFIMNFSPDTWWAGPDPSQFASPSNGEGGKAVDVISWDPLVTNPPLPAGSTFGPDSLEYRPSRRFPPGWPITRPGTFYEIYGDNPSKPGARMRLYARTEGDTVHMNSWIILWNGGYDKDSRYEVRADSTDPALHRPDGGLLAGPVLENAGVIGSPIGFRSIIYTRLTPTGLKSVPAQTSVYPVYEPASVFRAPRLGGYWRAFQAGKSYALARAEDADGGIDNSILDPTTVADAVPVVGGGGGTPEQQALRRKVLVFYVDKAPALVRNPFFRPSEGQPISTIQWNFDLRGMDLDPYDPLSNPAAGGPSTNTIIRYKVTLYGKSLAGRDTAWTYIGPDGFPYLQTAGQVAFNFVPGGTMDRNPFASGTITVSIQICDCVDYEGSPGQGRCVEGIDPATRTVLEPRNVIHVNYLRPPGEPGLGTTSTEGRPGPDSSGRRD